MQLHSINIFSAHRLQSFTVYTILFLKKRIRRQFWFESLTWQTIVVCPTFAPLIVCSTTVLMPWETDIWVCHYKQNDQYKLPPFMSCIMANTSESANKNTPTTTYQRPRRINNFLFMVRTGYCTISWTRQIPEKKKKSDVVFVNQAHFHKRRNLRSSNQGIVVTFKCHDGIR